VRTKRGTRQFKNWAAFYAGASSGSGRQQKFTISSSPTDEPVIRSLSPSVRSTIVSVATALAALDLREQLGKLASELSGTSSTWYERLSSDGRRGVVLRVMGQPYSKANSRRLVRGKGGRPASIKSEEALEYSAAWRAQCPALRFPLQGELMVCGVIAYGSERPDLDESLILDLMQGMIYKNDRQVRRRFFSHAIDTKNPRAVLLIEELAPADGQMELIREMPPSDDEPQDDDART
jgi:hypothetical protein